MTDFTKIKRNIITTAAVFVAVVFVGCGAGNEKQENVPSATEAVQMTEAPKATESPVPTEALIETQTPEITTAPEVTEEVLPTSAPEPREIAAAEYYKVFDINQSEASNEIKCDVSGMNPFGAEAYYIVTALFADGTYEQKEVKAVDGSVIAEFDRPAVKAEVSVVMKFSLGKDTSKAEDGFVNIPWTEQYDRTKNAGFEGKVDSHMRGVNLRSDQFSFVAAMPDGMYDVTVKKAEQARSTLRINGGAFGVNVGITGTDRKGEDKIFSARDVVVTGGEARLSSIGDGNLCYVEFRKASELIPRKTHVYIAGDSTVQTYYPRFDDREFPAGTAQTGWGQVFSHFAADGIIIDALGAGGTYARSWYEMYFQGIINNAQPGDYFIIQEGINDRTYSSTEEMAEYLTKMIDWCVENKVVPVLVTSQQTAKFWKSKDGAEIPEYGTPEGSGLYPFAETIRELAAKKGVFLIDNAAMTSEWYAKVGKTFVETTYHLYIAKTGKSVDSLHSSYMGSRKIAELIATDIASKIASGETDALGNTLSGIKLNEIEPYEFTYMGEGGTEVTETLNAVLYK